jgi:uncharacterized protein
MYRGPIIDCDVHNDWPSPSSLVPYLAKGWRELVTRSAGNYVGDGSKGLLPLTSSVAWPNPNGVVRDETWPDDGSLPGSSYEMLRDQLLDPFDVRRALLLFGSGMGVAALPNPYLASEVARAANDWLIHRWLDLGDERLYGSILLATQLPDKAAEEVRRVAGHPRMVQALLVSAGAGKPFGHPAYHPIYEACSEAGLPIAIHAGGEAFSGTNLSPIASGVPNLYLDYHVLNAVQGTMTHLVSLITHGVFEKYPDLKVILVEGGVAWIPTILWRFDADYRAVRKEAPWLRRHPSEYFHDHFRVTTQPLEVSPRRESLIELLSSFGAEDMLMFASDYPHWDTDDPRYVGTRLPSSWHEKVFHDNAASLFGWPRLAPEEREPAVGPAA